MHQMLHSEEIPSDLKPQPGDYTGKSSADLTWAEAAALAILPNSPALVFPGRNQEILKKQA